MTPSLVVACWGVLATATGTGAAPGTNATGTGAAPGRGATGTGAASGTDARASGKLAPAVASEMMAAIVALNKALGLESWPAHGVKPCIDRGGQGIMAKDVKPDDARKCAAAAVEKGYPELGKAYVLAVAMASIGPVTVVALGTGEAAGWGAYSCDPARTCKPIKLTPANKWGKRLVERQAKACADPTTLWVPGQRVCPPPAR